ncbi:hypothetical protein DY000_02010212 [Brassica cretica]|uniref:Uncharacterized protein n=1 Tax=Brassica cretica TaxID=69181 RepID=A0ABQ7BTK4_BRACR|nr:hypothetical protein DY000_02010212 [Brassica cretica]
MTVGSCLRPPTDCASWLLIPAIQSGRTPKVLKVLHIWDIGVFLESTHGRPSTCFFEPPVVIIDFSWCCLFSGQLQHFWYGSAKEQCFTGTGISVGLSRITNMCHVLCNRGAQRKLPGDFVGLWIDFIALITSLRTSLVHDLVRQKLAANSPVTSTSMAEFIQTSSREIFFHILFLKGEIFSTNFPLCKR